MSLTAKQSLFCQEYVANGYKRVPAYCKAFPDSSETSARVNAYKLLKRDDIKAYVKEIQKDRFEALNISADRIACELANMAFSDFDENNSATSKLKALDLLQKQLGLQNAKIEMNGEQKIIITIGDDEDA